MKLVRYGPAGGERPGVIIDDKIFDVSLMGEDYDERFFHTGGLIRLRNFVSSRRERLLEVPTTARIGPPIARPSKIVCIGLNFADHARESGAETPPEPVIFLKATSAICGPDDDVIIPKDSRKTDWEVELAVVIGTKASYVSEDHAHKFIAGYCLHNDLSEREFQLERNGTWDKGKGCNTFAPLGPWLVTPDEIPDVNALRMWLSVNGKMMQDGNTSNMIFNVPFLVSYVSRFMTLLPGDIISTGTPAGVGLGMKPPVYLKSGDVVELGIDGLGTSRQKMRSYNEN